MTWVRDKMNSSESFRGDSTRHRHFNIKTEKVKSASVYTRSVRFCLFGVKASLVIIHFLLFSHETK